MADLSKLVSYAVLDTVSEDASKLTGYAVLAGQGENLSKLVGYAVLEGFVQAVAPLPVAWKQNYVFATTPIPVEIGAQGVGGATPLPIGFKGAVARVQPLPVGTRRGVLAGIPLPLGIGQATVTVARAAALPVAIQARVLARNPLPVAIAAPVTVSRVTPFPVGWAISAHNVTGISSLPVSFSGTSVVRGVIPLPLAFAPTPAPLPPLPPSPPPPDLCAGIFPDSLPGIAWSVHREIIDQTRVQRAVSGAEMRALDYPWPLRRWTLTFDFLRDKDPRASAGGIFGGFAEMRTLAGFLGWARGAARSFCYEDPEDNYASRAPLLMLDSWAVAIGDASTVSFQLARPLQSGILEPVRAPISVDQVYLNGVPASASGLGWRISDPQTGVITFDTPPGAGVAITADVYYYWRVRFVDDALPFAEFFAQVWEQRRTQLITVPAFGRFQGAGSPPTPTHETDVDRAAIGGVQIGGDNLAGRSLQTGPLYTTRPNDVIVVWVVLQQSSANWVANVGPSPPYLNSVTSTSGLSFTRRFQWQFPSFPLGLFQPASVAVEEWWAIAPIPLGGEVISANFTGALLAGCIVGAAVSGVNPGSPFGGAPPVFNSSGMNATQASPSVSDVSTSIPGSTVLLFSASWSALNSGVLVCYGQLGDILPPGGGAGFGSIGQAFMGVAVSACAGYSRETVPVTGKSYVTSGEAADSTNWWVVLADAVVPS